MSHEITSIDHVALYREPAWHGLGTVVEHAMSPTQALEIAKLNWHVEQWELTAHSDDNTIALDTHRANVRMDTGTVLGVVTHGWTPFQNSEVAEFCEMLADLDDVVKVESAGSIRGGAKVWFLLRGESFRVRDMRDAQDEVYPYICVSNGFDGATSFRCTPTHVRVVCSNTLHAVIPQFEGKRVRTKLPGFVCKHTRNVKERIAQARNALGLYMQAMEEHKKFIDLLAARDITRQECQAFFLECYTRDFGAVPVAPTTTQEQRKRDAAMDCYNAFANRFDVEARDFGPTAWVALNAYTGWLQHDWTWRGATQEARLYSNLFGTNATRGADAFTQICKLAI